MLDHIQEILGTQIQIIINSQSPLAQKAMEAAFFKAKRIEQEYSRFLSDNQLSQLNAHMRTWTKVSPELFFLLETGKTLEEQSNGAFSLSVKSVLESWGYNEKYELGKEFPAGNTGSFELKKESHEVFLSAPIEIGAIGKGYALDQMRAVLSDFSDIFMNAGGDIYGRGKKDDGTAWTCYLEHPQDAEKAIGELILTDGFLTSSSPLKRQWRNRHHLIDARIKEPANNMMATYVQTSSGILADGYATTLFALGYEEAKIFTQTHKVQAMLIGKDGDIFISSGFQGKLYEKGI